MKHGWMTVGTNVWFADIGKKIKRMLFMMYTVTSALSGLTAFVIPEKYTDEIDTQVCKICLNVL